MAGPLRGRQVKGSTRGANMPGGGIAHVRDDVDSIVAHMTGVKAAVHADGRQREGRAKARLAGHRETGAAKVEGHKEDTDYVVSLVDPAALSIEYGRSAFTREDGRKVGPMEGLRILGRET